MYVYDGLMCFHKQKMKEKSKTQCEYKQYKKNEKEQMKRNSKKKKKTVEK